MYTYFVSWKRNMVTLLINDAQWECGAHMFAMPVAGKEVSSS
jgi:hypothetical protein